MSKTIIGCDPGASGGFAVRHVDGNVQAYKMPDTLTDIRDLVEGISQRHMEENIIVYCERVGGYVSGNAGPSAAKFAAHVGALKMLFCCLRLPQEYPTPQKWMDVFIGKQVYTEKKTDGYTPQAWKVVLAKRKQIRKNKIKEKAQQIYAHLKVTLATSDALGILHYACEQEKGKLI